MVPSPADIETAASAVVPTEADEAARRELGRIGDWLARMVTLSASLTGGGVFLLTDYTLALPFRVAVVLLLGGTICAVQGLTTGIDGGGPPHEPTAERARRLLHKKTWWLRRSLTALLAGLGLAVAGMLLR